MDGQVRSYSGLIPLAGSATRLQMQALSCRLRMLQSSVDPAAPWAGGWGFRIGHAARMRLGWKKSSIAPARHGGNTNER